MKKLNSRQRAKRIDPWLETAIHFKARKAAKRCPALTSIERRSAATNPDTLADTYNARIVYREYGK